MKTAGDELLAGYRALREGAAVFELPSRGELAVTGADAVDYLHRMASNDVKALAAGESCYAFLLDAQGHILADLYVIREAERVLLETESALISKIHQHLDRFTFMDDVVLENVSSQFATIAVEGPRAREVIGRLDSPVHIRTISGIWLAVPPEQVAALRAALLNAGAVPAPAEAVEYARIEAGIPRYGVDFDDRNIPQETGQLHAISFTKGCYPGQEIVERVRSRGHVNRTVTRLRANGSARIEAGAALTAAGRDAGRITSVANLPGDAPVVALGMVRREFTQPGTELESGGETVRVVA